jgi:hypothetical protein
VSWDLLSLMLLLIKMAPITVRLLLYKIKEVQAVKFIIGSIFTGQIKRGYPWKKECTQCADNPADGSTEKVNKRINFRHK